MTFIAHYSNVLNRQLSALTSTSWTKKYLNTHVTDSYLLKIGKVAATALSFLLPIAVAVRFPNDRKCAALSILVTPSVALTIAQLSWKVLSAMGQGLASLGRGNGVAAG
jgi:hypothetical protein